MPQHFIFTTTHSSIWRCVTHICKEATSKTWRRKLWFSGFCSVKIRRFERMYHHHHKGNIEARTKVEEARRTFSPACLKLLHVYFSACMSTLRFKHCVPTKRRTLYKLHGLTSQMTLLFILSAFRASNPANSEQVISELQEAPFRSLSIITDCSVTNSTIMAWYFISNPAKNGQKK